MTYIYIATAVNFLLMVASWIVSYKIFKAENPKLRQELDQIKKDVILVTRNPAQARRKLKNK